MTKITITKDAMVGNTTTTTTGSMMMTDKDLIDMLRTKQICTGFKPDGHGDVDIVYGPDPVTVEAADRIETLTAERDGLLRCVTDNHVALCRAEAAEAERDRLREALKGLMAHEPDYSDTLWQDAHAALKGETP